MEGLLAVAGAGAVTGRLAVEPWCALPLPFPLLLGLAASVGALAAAMEEAPLITVVVGAEEGDAMDAMVSTSLEEEDAGPAWRQEGPGSLWKKLGTHSVRRARAMVVRWRYSTSSSQ